MNLYLNKRHLTLDRQGTYRDEEGCLLGGGELKVSKLDGKC